MQTPADVPIVQESYWFVAADEERLRAMQEAQAASTDEARLEATLVVTNLWQEQIDKAADETLPEVMAAHEAEDSRARAAADWLGAWMEESERSFVEWANYLEQLVAFTGPEQAEAIAKGRPSARLESVKERAKELIYADPAAKGIDVAALQNSDRDTEPPPRVEQMESAKPETKVCPDCAEDVKAAARKCRFCGYRFDEAGA